LDNFFRGAGFTGGIHNRAGGAEAGAKEEASRRRSGKLEGDTGEVEADVGRFGNVTREDRGVVLDENERF